MDKVQFELADFSVNGNAFGDPILFHKGCGQCDLPPDGNYGDDTIEDLLKWAAWHLLTRHS
jgi:hypothetical protein